MSGSGWPWVLATPGFPWRWFWTGSAGGRFALANYNIRAAHTLLKILELVQAPA